MTTSLTFGKEIMKRWVSDEKETDGNKGISLICCRPLVTFVREDKHRESEGLIKGTSPGIMGGNFKREI